MSSLVENAKLISRFKKERFLLELSEDSFRDNVVRPLLLRKGFSDGRDLCGQSEKGKDTIFTNTDLLNVLDIYAVQTKKGKLNLAKKASVNIVECVTQLKTALETSIVLLKNREKKFPTKVILCASGKINESAKSFILEQVNTPRIIFMDVDDLIPMIDEKMPEFWFEMDSEIIPYLRALKAIIADKEQLFTKTEFMASNIVPVATSDEMFVPLRLYKYMMRPKTVSGRIEQEPYIEEFPVTSIPTKPQRLFLILGSAGTGKTTSLLRLAYTLADRTMSNTDTSNIKIPVLLRSQELTAENEITLLEYCANKTMEVSNSSKPAFTTNDLISGNLIIFIDGLDEVPVRSHQENIIRKVLSFHSTYPNCQIVITSRESSHLDEIQDLRKFTNFSLSPINYKQAQKILLRLQKKQSLSIERSSELLRRLQDVHGMELNPLLVTVYAATTDFSRADVPANITELFKKFTEMMLGRWDATKGLESQFQAPLKDFVLQKIAFEMHRRRVTKMSIEEFKELAVKELESRGHKTDVNLLVDEMLHRSGLFRILDSALEFRHLMLQEFFAGRGIPSVDVLDNLICDDWWKRAIIFFFGENPGNADTFNTLINSIPNKTPPEIFHALITLGLSLQASYLIKVDRKIPIYSWLVKSLSGVQESYERDIVASSKFPLHAFINYYIFSRDSVALTILKDYLDNVISSLKDDSLDIKQRDLRQFWIIIGLIETGAIDSAEQMVSKFHPADHRLLLGVHLSCFLLAHTRITDKHEKEVAHRIYNNISKSISGLRKTLLEEFKSELLEIRQKAIAAVKPESSE